MTDNTGKGYDGAVNWATHDGCTASPSCLTCPFADCILDSRLAGRTTQHRDTGPPPEPWTVSEAVMTLTLRTTEVVRRTGRSWADVRATRRAMRRNPANMAGFPPGPAADAYNQAIRATLGGVA